VAQPRIEVTAPVRRTLRGGLAQAAAVHEGASRRLGLAGLTAETDACATASCTWPAPCSGGVAPPGGKHPSSCCPQILTGDPFTVYAAACTDVLDPATAAERARAKLAGGRWRCIESQLFAHMQAAAVDVSPPYGSGATGIAGAVAALEQALGDVYDGQAVIHAPRYAAAFAARDRLVCGCGDMTAPVTVLGNAWAFGAGYSADGPNGQTSTECVFWLYATGAVDVYIGPVSEAGANDVTGNESFHVYEQSVATLLDCPGVYAARVTLTDCCTCGHTLPAEGPALTAADCT